MQECEKEKTNRTIPEHRRNEKLPENIAILSKLKLDVIQTCTQRLLEFEGNETREEFEAIHAIIEARKGIQKIIDDFWDSVYNDKSPASAT